MTVAATSRRAYLEHEAAGKLSEQQLAILNAMEPGQGYSRSELAEMTGIRLSSVCGRVNEMLQVGILTVQATRRCSVTRRTINPVAIHT